MGKVVALLSWALVAGLLLGQAILIVWALLGLPLTLAGIVAAFAGAALVGVVLAVWRGELAKTELEPRVGALPGRAIGPVLLAAGLIPFTLLNGWGDYGNESIWPWAAGFSSQAALVAGLIAWVRWKR